MRLFDLPFQYAACIAIAAAIFETFPAARAAASARASQDTPPLGTPIRGAEIYNDKCGACHSLDANRIGPKHRGVYGRMSGAVPDFHYSDALKRLHVTWNAATLDRWLQNPTAMAPGTAMGFSLPSAEERADVIAYLKQESMKH